MAAAKHFERDYYMGCTPYRIVLQFVEGPLQGIETEAGLSTITFGGEGSSVCLASGSSSLIPDCAKIEYIKGHYFMMNNYESSELSLFKC